MLTKVWSGPVQFLTAAVLHAPNANFKFLQIANTDKLILLNTQEGEHTTTITYPALECLRVLETDSLEVRVEPSAVELDSTATQAIELQIWRNIETPCGVCARAGKPAEADHKHCDITRERLPLQYPYAYSMKARDQAIATLIREGAYVAKVPLLNGQRTITIHSTTFMENDAKREWEQVFLTEGNGKDRSLTYYSEQEARLHLAYVLDDDGNGNSPAKSLTPEHQQLPSVQRSKLMMDFFKTYSDTYYRVLLEQVRRVDGLVEEVCAEDLVDHYTAAQMIELTDDILNNKRFTADVNIFGDKGKVYFTNVTTEDVSNANDWAEKLVAEIRKDSNGVILKFRELDILTVAKLAAEFRGDTRKQFSNESKFEERIEYLMMLPQPMFHMYVRAGNLWRLRVLKASEVDAVGNF